MSDGLAAKRRATMGTSGAGFAASLATWWLLYRYLPSPGIAPLPAAFALAALAALLTLVAGVEAIAHERLVTEAIDPLAGADSAVMRVNARYLQNTVEQFAIFFAGLAALANYASARILVIVTVIWVANRWAFWVGYRQSALKRAWGTAGMIQSMLVLFYVTWRFVGDNFGSGAAVAVLTLFGVIEIACSRNLCAALNKPGSR